jgi:tRNA G18 (ribose-2'-O)-methylase SpoU
MDFFNCEDNVKGYFGIGVENVSKAMNAGAVMRTAHAFGANFSFFVGGPLDKKEIRLSDTSKTENSLPTYFYDKPADIQLPKGCKLVGIELLDDADYLPSFRHPRLAAYILGSERLGLSENIISKCDYIIKVPTKFSLNLALTGGIVLYDRLTSMKQFNKRPLM